MNKLLMKITNDINFVLHVCYTYKIGTINRKSLTVYTYGMHAKNLFILELKYLAQYFVREKYRKLVQIISLFVKLIIDIIIS